MQIYTAESLTDDMLTQNIVTPGGRIIASQRYDNDSPVGWYFYNYDIRQSTTTILNEDFGAEKSYKYDEFGNTVESGPLLNEIAYTSAVSDSNTGLYYMNARYYNPNTGRFLTQDSYKGNPYDPWTQHLYSYAGNSPTNYIDPTGHKFIGASNDEWIYPGKRTDIPVISPVADTGEPMGNAIAPHDDPDESFLPPMPDNIQEQLENLVYLLNQQWDGGGMTTAEMRALIGSEHDEWCGETAEWCLPSGSSFRARISAYKNYQPSMDGYYETERYRSAKDRYVPQCGDIMYEYNPKGNPNDGHVTTVIGTIDNIVYSIEGNNGGKVRLVARSLDELAAGNWHYTRNALYEFQQPDITNLIDNYLGR